MTFSTNQSSRNAIAKLIALVAMLFVLIPTARAADDDFFPIMPWNNAPDDPAALKLMHDCGFTVAGFVQVSNLDRVQAAGMKAIVNDPRVGGYDWTNVDAATARKNVQSLIDQVGKHPAVMGYYLRDEPTANYFPGLEKVASVVRELAPGKWPYIDLFPNQALMEQGGSYEKYLADFIATCHPPILSYDHYALMDDGSLEPNYFSNLEQMRAAAKKAKIPFWNIVLSVATFNFAEPSGAGLRFQAYTTLAYGGRGLSWFTYFAPGVGSYRLAPIDQFGHPTPTWYLMQNMNLQIHKLAPALLKLTSDDVYHFGKIPSGCHGPDKDSLLIDAGSDQFMAGDFTHTDGSRWVMIVNRDLTRAHPCIPRFRTTPKQVLLLSPYTGELTPFAGEQTWLAPGQGSLLELQ